MIVSISHNDRTNIISIIVAAEFGQTNAGAASDLLIETELHLSSRVTDVFDHLT